MLSKDLIGTARHQLYTAVISAGLITDFPPLRDAASPVG